MLLRLLEAERPGGHVVGAHPQQRGDVHPALVGGQHPLGVGLDVPQRHRGRRPSARPAESVTVPRITPVVACACAWRWAGRRRAPGRRRRRTERNGRGTVMGGLPFRTGEDVRGNPDPGRLPEWADGMRGSWVGIAYRLTERSARLGVWQVTDLSPIGLKVERVSRTTFPSPDAPWTEPCPTAAPLPGRTSPAFSRGSCAGPPRPIGRSWQHRSAARCSPWRPSCCSTCSGAMRSSSRRRSPCCCSRWPTAPTGAGSARPS